MEHGKGDEHDRKTSRSIRSVFKNAAHTSYPACWSQYNRSCFLRNVNPKRGNSTTSGFTSCRERRERRAISIVDRVQYRRTVLTMSSLVTCSCGRRGISTLGDHVEAYSSYHCPNQHVRKRILKESDIAENQQRAQRTRQHRKSIGRASGEVEGDVHLTNRAKTNTPC